MPRNIVICCDGTNNSFGYENTNVVRLVQVLDRDPLRQLVYYDPGLGTLPEPGALNWLQKWVSILFGLAFGAGIGAKVSEAYCYLMDFWEEGDQVFMFGFSRGAYTVRVLAGLLHSLGLMPRGNENLVPYALKLYKAVRKEGDPGNKAIAEYWKLCDEFRRTFARPIATGDDDRRFPVHFVGLWDTVSSVGWVWEPKSFPFTSCNPSIAIVRHAVSIDERRCMFRQNLMHKGDGQDIQQHWFAGVHGDVGGGYPAANGSWKPAFDWIVGTAKNAGLLLNQARFTALSPADDSCTENLHESLTWLWWPLEFLPKRHWLSTGGYSWPKPGLGRHRRIAEGSNIGRAALTRIRDVSTYNPPNLSKVFLKKVRELPVLLPDSLPYAP